MKSSKYSTGVGYPLHNNVLVVVDVIVLAAQVRAQVSRNDGGVLAEGTLERSVGKVLRHDVVLYRSFHT